MLTAAGVSAFRRVAQMANGLTAALQAGGFFEKAVFVVTP